MSIETASRRPFEFTDAEIDRSKHSSITIKLQPQAGAPAFSFIPGIVSENPLHISAPKLLSECERHLPYSGFVCMDDGQTLVIAYSNPEGENGDKLSQELQRDRLNSARYRLSDRLKSVSAGKLSPIFTSVHRSPMDIESNLHPTVSITLSNEREADYMPFFFDAGMNSEPNLRDPRRISAPELLAKSAPSADGFVCTNDGKTLIIFANPTEFYYAGVGMMCPGDKLSGELSALCDQRDRDFRRDPITRNVMAR